MITDIPFAVHVDERRSKFANSETLINMYAEQNNRGRAGFDLYRTPGLISFASLSGSPVRGLIAVSGVLYAVSGNAFYSVNSSGTGTSKGTLNTSSGRVSMASNGNEIMVVDGTDGWIYNITADTFTQITDADFPGASTVVYVDTYFMVFEPNTQKIYVSGNLDGTAWNALDFASAESDPDLVKGIAIKNNQPVIFGERTIEFFYNDAGQGLPFSRYNGATAERGLASEYSIASVDNTLFFLGDDGLIYRLDGNTPIRISTDAIEDFISGFTHSDAFAYTYTEGHKFYVLTFPSDNKTIVYDVTTGLWHRRSSRINSVFGGRHRSNCYARCYDKHFVGDFESGTIYEQSLTAYDEAGQLMRWEAISPPYNNSQRNLRYYSLEFTLEPGVGLTSGQGSDPQVLLSWSDNGGITFGNEIQGSPGKIGEYWKRVKFNRLGTSRNRVWKLAGTDPVNIVGASAVANVEQNYS